MDSKSLRDSILYHIGHTPTTGQKQLAEMLAAFVENNIPKSVFVLKGYAGTGKTTMVSSLVKVLFERGAECVLLAPTGRAAKVLSNYSGFKAYTIHKKIYWVRPQPEGNVRLKLQTNKHKNTIFIVDEASLIATSRTQQGDLFDSVNLLNDLIEYIGSGINCKLILTGDTAQLPPVMSKESLALNPEFLSERYSLHIVSFTLTVVVRQALESGILVNATKIRKMLAENSTCFPKFVTTGFNDFKRVEGMEVSDSINSAFMGSNPQDSLIICRSNKRANLFNKMIRNRVLFREEELSSGDLIMVVKNNYFWLPENSNPGFIANGDILQIRRLRKSEEMYGFRFADVVVKLIDYPDEPELEVKILLDTIDTDGPALSPDDDKRLYESISKDFDHIANKSVRLQQIKSNPHLNALQIKFAYSLTCHKAQGGQWENVFVEMGTANEVAPDEGQLRWLYTAITRATGKIFLLNFSDDFFANQDL